MKNKITKKSFGKTHSNYSITCIQRPPNGSNKSGLLQQVVKKYMFYQLDFTSSVVSEQWSLKAVNCLIQVVSDTGLTVLIYL